MPDIVTTAQTPPTEWSSQGNPLGTAPTFTVDAVPTFSGTVTHSGTTAFSGQVTLGGAIVTSTPAAAQDISGNGQTITLPTAGITKEITAGAARTGTIITAGTVDGQLLILFNSSAAANSVTMAAAGTSNVADGTSCVIPGLRGVMFAWDSGASRWFQLGTPT